MRLILYPTSGVAPPVRPAPATRPWMDATPEGFAYRCLPLNIANAHGWEFLCPSTVRARWRGGKEIASIDVEPIEDKGWLPISHFGSGVLTFHVGYLARTEPGCDLWVSGPTNAPKDGIQALTGVVETDWTNATFTMNWLFTRADHWVTFEKGEPFCSFFPILRETVDTAEPEIRSLDEAPETRDAFRAWSKSRSTFSADLKTPGTKAREEKWQKDYYLGRVDETRRAEAHRSKLRLPDFRDTTKK